MTLQQDRMNELEKCVKLEKTNYVPLEHVATPELAIEYAGFPLFDGLWNTDMLLSAMDKTLSDFDADYVRSLGFRSPRYYSALGAKSFVQSAQGFVQHPEVHSMEQDEYDELIANPVKFMAEKCVPRIFTEFDKEEPYRTFALSKGMMCFNRVFGPFNAGMAKILEKTQLTSVCATSTEAPFDFLADLLRSFTGISMDVRRKREKVKQACEVLTPVMLNKGLSVPAGIERMVFMPLHMPPFLNESAFSELWWPTFKLLTEQLIEHGHYLYIFFEGDWSRYYDYLSELTPKKIMGRFEYADPKTVKEKVGNTMCIQGFYPLTLLASGTQAECVDKAKELIDILAPGGGFVFNFDKIATSLSDITPQNVHAVNEAVRKYGKY